MVISFVLMIWLGVASQAAKSQGFVHNQMKSFSIENCSLMNSTLISTDGEFLEPKPQEYVYIYLLNFSEYLFFVIVILI